MATSSKPKRKIRKCRVRWGRVFTSLALTASLGVGISNLIQKHKDKNKNEDNNSIYFDIDVLDGEFDNDFDDSKVINYYMSDTFDVYQEFENAETPIKIGCMSPNQSIKVYNFYSCFDDYDYEYFYCEIPQSNLIGMIKESDLSKGTIISEEKAKFNNVYIIDTKKDINVGYNTSPNISTNFCLKNDDIVFVDSSEEIKDEKGKDIVKVRNGKGQLGYVEFNDNFKNIKDSSIVEFKPDIDISELFSLNMPLDERMVCVKGENNGTMANLIYYDNKGILKSAEVNRDMIKEIDVNTIVNEINFDKFNSFEQTQKAGFLSKLSNNIINWQNNSTNGYYGIDISESMLPDHLIYLLDTVNRNNQVKYGIIKIGASGYGSDLPSLTYAKDSTVIYNENKKDTTKKQVEIFKQRNIPVFGYFYGTSTNVIEGLDIAEHIEACIDEVDKDLIPILDVEMHEDGIEDRMYFLNNPNYENYIQNGGKPVDLNYMKTLDEISLIEYVDSHPEVIEYVDYCQDLMAQSIASIYHKLSNDGYIKSDSILLYTGNKSVSKDSYKATIKTGQSSYEKISLFKFSDVEEYLNNPNSPYYISKSVKVWYADYTDQENYKSLGDAVVMHQYVGDEIIAGTDSSYDENYACEEFIDSIIQSKEIKNLEYEDSER